MQKTYRDIHTTIKAVPASLNLHNNTQEILLSSGDLDRFVNVHVSNNDMETDVCIIADDAKRLRDALVQAYPLPVATPAPATKTPPKGAQ